MMNKIEQVWAALTDMYGSKFMTAYGDKPSQMWTVAINGFKEHEIQRGLRKLLHKGAGTPPTLPQFVVACKYSEEDDQTPNPPTVALPRIASQYDEPVWCHGQKCLFAFLWKSTRRYTDEQVKEMVAIKNKIVSDFKLILAEDNSLKGSEIRDALFAAWGKV